MFIDSISLQNFRTFQETKISFVHPDQDFEKLGLPKPRLPNINLLLGNNGWGKTTLLKAIALAAFGPARPLERYADAGYFVRREPGSTQRGVSDTALVEASFTVHPQDKVSAEITHLESWIEVIRIGDSEQFNWGKPNTDNWDPIFSADSSAFFFVGYGATRRVGTLEYINMREQSKAVRLQRVQSLFEEGHGLMPLESWLFALVDNRGEQVIELINALMGEGHYIFSGGFKANEYMFERGDLALPFSVLSDGYRAFIGLVGDLLYHIAMITPVNKDLKENHGIVMVDEIDLHLHPKWQMTALERLAKVLPNIQFIVTSHSPLVAGSLEWMNIISMQSNPNDQSSVAKRIDWPVHGLDADQILLTDFFGLESTRAPGKQRALKELTLKARHGDIEAAKALLEAMSEGMEDER